MEDHDTSVGELSTNSVRQPGSAGVELAYAGVVATKTAPNK